MSLAQFSFSQKQKHDPDEASPFQKKLAFIFSAPLYFVLWILGLMVLWTPYRARYFWARLDALFLFHVIRFRRKIICHNLCLVFPRRSAEPVSLYKKRIEDLCYQNYIHYLLSFYEVLERFHLSQKSLGYQIEVEGKEIIERLKAQNRGYFFLTSHLGNWELMSKIGVLLNLPLAIVTKFLRNPFFDALWVRSRKNYGLYLIPERRSGFEIVRVIQKKGMAVGFMLDQHTGEPHGIASSFLGQPVMTAKALAILSQRIQAPIVPAYLFRTSEGKTKLVCEEAIEAEQFEKESGLKNWRDKSGSLTPEALGYHVRRCNEIMERWVFQYPEQYLWLHKRFKNFHNYKAPLPWEL